MALTAAQRGVTSRVDLGGDALEALNALGGAGGMTPLKVEVVTMTAVSAPLESLLAGAAYQTGVKQVSIKAAAAWSYNAGAAAAMGTVTLDGGVWYVIQIASDTALEVIAGGSVAALVIQEG